MQTGTHSLSEPVVPQSWLLPGLLCILVVYSILFYVVPALHDSAEQHMRILNPNASQEMSNQPLLTVGQN